MIDDFDELDSVEENNVVKMLLGDENYDDLFELFTYETSIGKNAWYLYRTRGGGTNFYGNDVENVFEKMISLVPGPENGITPDDLFRFQVFFGLLQSTMNSLLQNSNADIVKSLSKEGDQSDEQLLIQIKSIPDSEEKTKAILAIARQRPQLFEKLAEIVRGIPSDYWQGNAIRGLVFLFFYRYPSACIDLLRRIRSDNSKYWTLMALFQNVSEEWHSQVLEVLDSFTDLEEQESAFMVMALLIKGQAVVQALPYALKIENVEHKAIALCSLVQKLPEEYIDQVLTVARTIPDPLWKSSLLEMLSERFTGVQREELIKETLKSIDEISDIEKRSDQLNDFKKRFGINDQVIESIQPTMIVEIGKDFKDPAGYTLEEMFSLSARQAIETAGQVDEHTNRAYALASASLLIDQEETRTKALDVARMIEDHAKQAKALAKLAVKFQDDWGFQVAEEALAAVRQTYRVEQEEAIKELFDIFKEAHYLPLCLQIAQQQPNRLKLLSSLSSELLQTLYQDCFELLLSTPRWQGNEDGQKILKAIAPKLPETEIERLLQSILETFSTEKIEILEILSSYLQPNQIQSILGGSFFEEYESDENKAKIILAILPFVPKESQSSVAQDALQYIQAMKIYDRDRSGLMASVIEYLPEEARKIVLQDAVESAQVIADNYEVGNYCFQVAKTLIENGQILRAMRFIPAAWKIPAKLHYEEKGDMSDRMISDLVGIIRLFPSLKKYLYHLPERVSPNFHLKPLRRFDKLRQKVIFRLGYWGALWEDKLSPSTEKKLGIISIDYVLQMYLFRLPPCYFPEIASMFPKMNDPDRRERLLAEMIERVPFSELVGILPWLEKYGSFDDGSVPTVTLNFRIFSAATLLRMGLLDLCLSPDDATVARALIDNNSFFKEISFLENEKPTTDKAINELLDITLQVTKANNNSGDERMLQMLTPVLSSQEHFIKTREICALINDKEKQLETIMLLLPKIPEELLPDFIRLIFPISSDDHTLEKLEKLTNRILALPEKTKWQCWRVMLKILANQPRYQFLENLAGLFDLMKDIGGKDATFFAGQAVLRLINWWA